MKWYKTWAKVEEQLYARYKKEGVMPQALKDKPSLPWLADSYLHAYLWLDRRRQMGYAATQPLSVEAIILYGQTHGFKKVLKFFCRVISALDDNYIEEQAAELKRRNAKGKHKASKARKSGRRR